jgi:UDP-N-acetylmuramate--alanine ligase
MISSINDFQHPFFMGVAGSGMSALAQYLKGIGKDVSGSDRFFAPGVYNETQEKLEAEGISCFVQNGEGITGNTDLVVVSTAIEDTVPEMQKAKQMNIPIMRRSELLALIAASKKTIAVAGTSGKSTTSAMLFDILEHAGYEPSIISGAGLVSIIKKGKIGNAKVGKGDWLVIEADESDGSIVQYKPEIGLLLNIDKDHQEIDELIGLFTTFKNHSKHFSVNQGHDLTAQLSQEVQQDFSTDPGRYAGYQATGFKQKGFEIRFTIAGTDFRIQTAGKHNMENALAAVTVANGIGVPLETCAEALSKYEGIYRRHQVYGQKNGVWMVDDYAHNPVKCAAAISACQPVAPKVIAWFQPHGYKPTKFLREDFVKEIGDALRPEDEIWMSEIFYAGGTAVKDISSADLINDLRAKGKNAFFVDNRDAFLEAVRPHLSNDCVLLLMAARDPSLEQFAKKVWEKL